MDSIELHNRVKNLKLFRGIYPRNELYNIKYLNGYIVVNTNDSSEPGEHWVAIYFTPQKGEYFDPFGLPPLHSDFVNFLNKKCSRWCYNNKTIQDPLSKKCGKYCIAFLLSKLKNVSFIKFLQMFKSFRYNEIYS